MSKREYTWYIEPLDVDTNQTISSELPEENFHRGIRCADGRKHNLWECDFAFAQSMYKSRESLALSFNILSREGKGKIRSCPEFVFMKDMKRKKRKKRKQNSK